jgi:hypothetical protein
MFETMAAAGLVGFIVGWLAGRRPGPEKPMRLVKLNDFRPPGLVARSWTEEENWRMHLCSFDWHGSLIGFSYRAMKDAGIVRRAAWETYTQLLVEEGILQRHERSATTWAGGWSAVKLNVALRHRTIPLPRYPKGNPPELNSALLSAQLAQANVGSTRSTEER